MSSKTSKLCDIENQISEVQYQAARNIEKVIERGENIDSLSDKADELKTNSIIFQNSSKKVARDLKCKYYKRNGIILFIIILFISLFIWAISS
jgi:tetrahydromethanopterin S-methyltransferase subunit G